MSNHLTESTSNPGWSPTAIRDALPVGAMAKLARRHRVSHTLISKVVARRVRSLRIEEAIAKIVARPREEIFGAYRRPGRRPDEVAA